MIAAAAATSVLAACGTSGRGAGDDRFDSSALTAANVIGRGSDPQPVAWAATEVVGTARVGSGEQTVSALRVRGSTFSGAITLRFTFDSEQGYQATHDVACYSVVFDRSAPADDARTRPKVVDCPDVAALTLPAPPPAPRIDRTSARRLAALVASLPAARRTSVSDLRRVLAPELGAWARWTVLRAGQGQLFLRVAGDCATFAIPASSPPTVQSTASGTDCYGG